MARDHHLPSLTVSSLTGFLRLDHQKIFRFFFKKRIKSTPIELTELASGANHSQPNQARFSQV